MAARKKKMARTAKDRAEIKQEEALTKRNVKTILDEEAASAERQAIASER